MKMSNAIAASMFMLCAIGTSSKAMAADGDKLVTQVCSNCHGAGLMGAPRIGNVSDWQARLKTAGSVDALVESAEHGKGNMPPRGGMSSLTDNDLKAAIEVMLAKSKVEFKS